MLLDPLSEDFFDSSVLLRDEEFLPVVEDRDLFFVPLRWRRVSVPPAKAADLFD